jgi:hypothetical protein
VSSSKLTSIPNSKSELYRSVGFKVEVDDWLKTDPVDDLGTKVSEIWRYWESRI